MKDERTVYRHRFNNVHQTREFFGIEDIDDLDPSFAGPREYHGTFFQENTSNLSNDLPTVEHGEFDRMLQGPPRPGMMLPQQEKDKHLHSVIGDFIHSSRTGQVRNLLMRRIVD